MNSASTLAFVVRPSCSFLSKDGCVVPLQGFIPAHLAPEKKVESFKGAQSIASTRIDSLHGWKAIERSVRVCSHDGLREEAKKLATEIKRHFGPIEVSIH